MSSGPSRDTGSLRGLIRSGAGIAVAMGVMNVATYGFVILASRLLGPREYGGVASMMALLLVASVLALGLQATGARRVAADPSRRDEIEDTLLAATNRAALGLGGLLLVLTPLISWALSLDDWAAAAMIAVAAVPQTIMGGQAGILQGEQRWLPLSTVYLAMGLGRIALGVALMPFLSDAFGAMLAVAIGAWVPVIVGSLALGRIGAARRVAERGRATAAVLREVGGNCYALLAFFALSNTDVILARIRFDEHESGLYAGGIILAKAVLFLPQFVVVIVFPSMASSSSQHRMYLRALVVVGMIGALATAGAAVLSDLAVTFIGGDAYSAVEPDIWLFGTVGTLLALVQLMVYEVVARQHRASVSILWGGLVAVAVAGSLVDGIGALVRAVAVVELGVLLALVLTAIFHPAMQTQDEAAGPGDVSALR